MAHRPEKLQESFPGLGQILFRLWPYLRKRSSLISVSMLVLLSSILLRLLEPWPLKFIFDRVIPIAPVVGERTSFIPDFETLAPTMLLANCVEVPIIAVASELLAVTVPVESFVSWPECLSSRGLRL